MNNKVISPNFELDLDLKLLTITSNNVSREEITSLYRLSDYIQKKEAFEDLIETIIVKDSVNFIPSRIFNNFKKLKKVLLTENVKKIGNNVFQNCNSLTELYINGNELDLSSAQNTFKWCSNITFFIKSTSIKEELIKYKNYIGIDELKIKEYV